MLMFYCWLFQAKSSEEMEQSIDVGLVKGHAYGITNVKTVTLEGTAPTI